jgi:hypothetical protein
VGLDRFFEVLQICHYCACPHGRGRIRATREAPKYGATPYCGERGSNEAAERKSTSF